MNLHKYHKFLLHLVICFNAVFGQDDLLIETENGMIKGFRDKAPTANGEEVDCWYGIPYAEPPLGELRFRHPQPVKKWADVKETTKLPNACPQLVDKMFPGFVGAEVWNPNTPISEDCLYLQVVAPSKRASKLAVMVWIYGGGFSTGSSTLDVYDHRTLAATEQVIVVSMQYRVGSLGFLYFGTSEAPGNVGLFDQLMALEFVKKNIEKFGGDPDNISLFGESAGSASVNYHLLSPKSRNLFNQAILQSGSATSEWAMNSRDESIQRGLRLAENLNCPHDRGRFDDVVKCLRKREFSELLKHELDSVEMFEFPFVPVVDNDFLLEEPSIALTNGNFKRTPLLIGSNQNEGYYFLFYYLRTIFEKRENVLVNRENFLRAVDKIFPSLDEVVKEAIIFQYTDWSNSNDSIRNRDNIDRIIGDKYITCDLDEVATRYAQAGNYVYRYYFTHRSSQQPWPSWSGVMHADEINFVFGKPLDPMSGYTVEEVELSKLMMGYWANFAKSGTPSLYSNGTWNKLFWPVYTAYEREYLILNTNATEKVTIGRDPQTRECAFWKNYLPTLIQRTTNIQPRSEPCPTEPAQICLNSGCLHTSGFVAGFALLFLIYGN